MSCSTLYKIEANGDVVAYDTFPNAFRGAMYIWSDLGVRYGIITPDERLTCLLNMGTMQNIWDLVKRPDVSRHHKIIMLATLDYRLCAKRDFKDLIAAFRQYDKELGLKGNSCHAHLWAESVEQLPEDCLGCGWQHTSVMRNSWEVEFPSEVEGEKERRPYNVYKDRHCHIWMFDELRLLESMERAEE